MHATSDDLQHWTKIPEHTFFAPPDKYEQNDWRDPYVFFNEDTQDYNMLLAARLNKGMPRRRGVTALCTSKDLVKWQVQDHFYAPNQFITHECPDLFKMGDWWYLVFSEYCDVYATRYRMSRSLKGPWLTPKQDTFDGHAFYAAKTASDGKRRFVFGWNPTRSDNKDSGGWNWGGNLVTHEVVQQANGELSVRVPDTVSKPFNRQLPLDKNEIEIKADGIFNAVTGGKMPARCKISMTVVFDKAPRNFGCILRSSDDFDKGYYLRVSTDEKSLIDKNKTIKDLQTEIDRLLRTDIVSAQNNQQAERLIKRLNTQIVNIYEQIRELRAANQLLTEEKTVLVCEKEEYRKFKEDLEAEVAKLASKASTASTLVADSMQVMAVRTAKGGTERIVKNMKKADKFRLSFNVFNRIIEAGETNIFITIIDPDGKTIKLPNGNMEADSTGANEPYTVMLPVEVQPGVERAIQFQWPKTKDFKKGNYVIFVYHNGFKIGEVSLALDKSKQLSA